jgi:hypothetical protein
MRSGSRDSQSRSADSSLCGFSAEKNAVGDRPSTHKRLDIQGALSGSLQYSRQHPSVARRDPQVSRRVHANGPRRKIGWIFIRARVEDL